MDRIIDFSVRNRFLVLVLATLAMAAGWHSYRNLPVDAFPDVSPNLVQVFTITEGLAPEEVEKFVTFPIEVSMNGLPGIENIRSVSNFGLSVVNVYFEDGMDIYLCRQLVGERLLEAREQIPQGFGEPEMGPIATGMGLVLFYYLEDTTGTYSLEELRAIQDWTVKFHLQTVPGVTEVLGIGGYEKQYQVIVNPDALLRYDVTLVDVIDRVEANNLNVGAQYIEQNAEEFIVRGVGLATSIDDLKSIVIKTADARPIYLHDVAEITTGGAIRRGLQTRNGQGEVVAGMVVKLFGTNSSTVIQKVEKKIAEIDDILPDGVNIVPYYEQKTLVEASVATVNRALVESLVLVVIMALVFLVALRPSIVVLLAIPFSMAFAALGMNYLGMSANLMSLGGLAIAIGLLVDGSIVMVENVDSRLHETGPDESRMLIVVRACKEVARPIVFSLTIIIIVFAPLFTLKGVEGKTFRPLAYAVALAMAGSLIYAVTLVPLLCDLIMRQRKKSETGNSGHDQGHEPFVVRMLMKPYRPCVTLFVRWRGIAIGLAAILLAIGALIFPRLGAEFTPKLNEGTIVVRLTMAPSISLEESRNNVLRVERRLLTVPEVTGVTSRVGRGEVGAHADPVNSAEMFVELKHPTEWRQPRDQEWVEDQLRMAIGSPPGILVNFTQPIEMSIDELLEGVRAELAIKLFGDDLDTLKTHAEEIAAVVRTVRGATDVQVNQISGAPQLIIEVNRKAIARYGVNVRDVLETIQAAIGGHVAGEIFEGVKRFEILVRYPADSRSTPEQIAELLIPGPQGERIPLADLASITTVVGPRQITREKSQRFISIQCNVNQRDIGSFVAEAQGAIADQVDLQPGYLVTWGGQYKLQQQANARLIVVVPITLLLIFILLYNSFQSLKNSFLILLNIPLALVGGITALWLSGQNLSVPASVGFIALFGIALANGMVLVTCINQLVRDGVPIDDACIRGACMRLRPVLMTATAAALGLIPLLFSQGTGSEVQRPLATVVVGGLVTSTVLTLLVLPALYKWFAIRKEVDAESP
ncbi:MAG: efflux RND transporter permease subunit [Planctomycetes bacterium]|nr:efflux RND transporter permease subunit [Planctomycetota bacterium]